MTNEIKISVFFEIPDDVISFPNIGKVSIIDFYIPNADEIKLLVISALTRTTNSTTPFNIHVGEENMDSDLKVEMVTQPEGSLNSLRYNILNRLEADGVIADALSMHVGGFFLPTPTPIPEEDRDNKSFSIQGLKLSFSDSESMPLFRFQGSFQPEDVFGKKPAGFQDQQNNAFNSPELPNKRGDGVHVNPYS